MSIEMKERGTKNEIGGKWLFEGIKSHDGERA